MTAINRAPFVLGRMIFPKMYYIKVLFECCADNTVYKGKDRLALIKTRSFDRQY